MFLFQYRSMQPPSESSGPQEKALWLVQQLKNEMQTVSSGKKIPSKEFKEFSNTLLWYAGEVEKRASQFNPSNPIPLHKSLTALANFASEGRNYLEMVNGAGMAESYAKLVNLGDKARELESSVGMMAYQTLLKGKNTALSIDMSAGFMNTQVPPVQKTFAQLLENIKAKTDPQTGNIVLTRAEIDELYNFAMQYKGELPNELVSDYEGKADKGAVTAMALFICSKAMDVDLNFVNGKKAEKPWYSRSENFQLIRDLTDNFGKEIVQARTENQLFDQMCYNFSYSINNYKGNSIEYGEYNRFFERLGRAASHLYEELAGRQILHGYGGSTGTTTRPPAGPVLQALSEMKDSPLLAKHYLTDGQGQDLNFPGKEKFRVPKDVSMAAMVQFGFKTPTDDWTTKDKILSMMPLSGIAYSAAEAIFYFKQGETWSGVLMTANTLLQFGMDAQFFIAIRTGAKVLGAADRQFRGAFEEGIRSGKLRVQNGTLMIQDVKNGVLVRTAEGEPVFKEAGIIFSLKEARGGKVIVKGVNEQGIEVSAKLDNSHIAQIETGYKQLATAPDKGPILFLGGELEGGKVTSFGKAERFAKRTPIGAERTQPGVKLFRPQTDAEKAALLEVNEPIANRAPLPGDNIIQQFTKKIPTIKRKGVGLPKVIEESETRFGGREPLMVYEPVYDPGNKVVGIKKITKEYEPVFDSNNKVTGLNVKKVVETKHFDPEGYEIDAAGQRVSGRGGLKTPTSGPKVSKAPVETEVKPPVSDLEPKEPGVVQWVKDKTKEKLGKVKGVGKEARESLGKGFHAKKEGLENVFGRQSEQGLTLSDNLYPWSKGLNDYLSNMPFNFLQSPINLATYPLETVFNAGFGLSLGATKMVQRYAPYIPWKLYTTQLFIGRAPIFNFAVIARALYDPLGTAAEQTNDGTVKITWKWRNPENIEKKEIIGVAVSKKGENGTKTSMIDNEADKSKYKFDENTNQWYVPYIPAKKDSSQAFIDRAPHNGKNEYVIEYVYNKDSDQYKKEEPVPLSFNVDADVVNLDSNTLQFKANYFPENKAARISWINPQDERVKKFELWRGNPADSTGKLLDSLQASSQTYRYRDSTTQGKDKYSLKLFGKDGKIIKTVAVPATTITQEQAQAAQAQAKAAQAQAAKALADSLAAKAQKPAQEPPGGPTENELDNSHGQSTTATQTSFTLTANNLTNDLKSVLGEDMYKPHIHLFADLLDPAFRNTLIITINNATGGDRKKAREILTTAIHVFSVNYLNITKPEILDSKSMHDKLPEIKEKFVESVVNAAAKSAKSKQ